MDTARTPVRVHNPYLEAKLEADQRLDGQPQASELEGWMEYIRTREQLVKKYAWAVPNDEAIAACVEAGPIVEVGAGLGYWAHLIVQAGGDVIAYDTEPDPERNDYVDAEPWFQVHRGGAEAAGRHPDRALMLIWPPYGEEMAAETLRHYEGDTVIYVGEGRGGCTGGDNFIEQLEERFELVKTVHIPTWRMVHDHLTIWRRR